MILAAILLGSAGSPPLNIEVFFDEPAAGQALDAQMACLGSGTFKRRLDDSDVQAVAAEVVRSCVKTAETLRTELIDVFSRKPHLRPANTSPAEAADFYVREMNAVVERVVIEGRERK